MNEKFLTRMGDGARVWMTLSELKEDLLEGMRDATEMAEIPELTPDDLAQILDTLTDPSRAVSVTTGNEVVMTDDGGGMLFPLEKTDGGVGIPVSRMQALLSYERACGGDTLSLGHTDFSFKPVKPVINMELQEYYNTSLVTTAPMFYSAQPNMGTYYQPDGPCVNPSEYLQQGKIQESQETQEEAARHLKKDILFIVKKFNEIGCEGVNFDTSGSAGDAELKAVLETVREIKGFAPDLPIIVGGAGEFVLGIHGTAQFDGKGLAGMYPHQLVKVVEAAGADIFGPAVNVNTSKSFAWNLAHAATLVKETVAVADIPVHPNVGMGVGGVPMDELPPIECVTRVSKTLVEIGKADGL